MKKNICFFATLFLAQFGFAGGGKVVTNYNVQIFDQYSAKSQNGLGENRQNAMTMQEAKRALNGSVSGSPMKLFDPNSSPSMQLKRGIGFGSMKRPLSDASNYKVSADSEILADASTVRVFDYNEQYVGIEALKMAENLSEETKDKSGGGSSGKGKGKGGPSGVSVIAIESLSKETRDLLDQSIRAQQNGENGWVELNPESL